MANEGKLTNAEILFAKTSVESDEPAAYRNYADFLMLLERLDQAEVVYNKSNAIAAQIKSNGDVAKALGKLILIHKTRGDLNIMRKMIKPWISVNNDITEASFVYKSWLDAGGELEFVRDSIGSWLLVNKDIPEARFVYQPWFNAGGELEFVRESIGSWLLVNKDIVERQSVYDAWLHAGGEEIEIE